MKRNTIISIQSAFIGFLYMLISMVILPYGFDINGTKERLVIPLFFVIPLAAVLLWIAWRMDKRDDGDSDEEK